MLRPENERPEQEAPTGAENYPIDGRMFYHQGKRANRAGKPYEAAQNIDWQRGWSDEQDDRSFNAGTDQ